MKRDLMRASLRWQMGCVMLLLLAISAGCGGPAPAAVDDQRDAAAIDLALCLAADMPALPLPTPSKCAKCNGLGYIVQGDGHRTPCPVCQAGRAGLTLYVPASATISDKVPMPDLDPPADSPCAGGQCSLTNRSSSPCSRGQCPTVSQPAGETTQRMTFTRRGLLFRWRR